MKLSRILLLGAIVVLPSVALAVEPGQSFVPLTNIPGLTDNTAPQLPVFLNNLYKLCIGVAAVLAVLQIIRGGIIYMGGDSVTEKKTAKDLIRVAILGLLLVLSPVIVFSIINPKILDLDLSGSIAGIKSTGLQSTQNSAVDPKLKAAGVRWVDTTYSYLTGTVNCTKEGGLSVYLCTNPTTKANHPEALPSSCTNDETIGTICMDHPANGQTPVSVIQSNGKANPGCPVVFSDGTALDGSNSQEQCCANQISASVTCSVTRDAKQVERCSCTTK